jgi:hypothetical protein
MKHRTRMATGLILAAVVLPAGAAEAKQQPVEKVRADVSTVNHLLGGVPSLVNAGRDGAVADRLAAIRQYLGHATRVGTRMNKRGRRALRALAGAGFAANRCVDMVSFLVDELDGAAQLDSAELVEACLKLREKVLGALTQLMDVAPEELKPYLAELIAKLSTDGEDDVQGITNTLQDPTLPVDVATVLQHALELATGAIDLATERLQGIVELVPEEYRPLVEEAIGMVTEQLQMVQDLLTQLFQDLLGQLPGVPGAGGPLGLPLLDGLFGPGFPFNLVPLDLPFQLPGFGFAVR